MVMISFNNVCKIYSGKKVFYDTSINIKKGDFIFLTGESGSGKTTFLRLISALEKPDKGDILVDDLSITKLNNNEISDYRKSVGIIMQDNYFVEDRTVNYNISLPLLVSHRKEINRKIRAVLDLVNLNNQGNKIIQSLSAGERQRVAIARAIIHRPNIILADEPTGNLDQNLSKSIINMLIKLSQYGATVVVATHEFNLVRELQQKIINISNEKIISE
tara:strand:+ start:3892 stop:4545 length:654 start_codon:yes stop_codon:yes gene_type:complete